VTWERELLDLFEDLEHQAEGLALADRDAEVAELARSEYAEVTLASRLHASVGRPLELTAAGIGPLRGRLRGAGNGWLLLEPAGTTESWLVSVGSLTAVRGLATGARPADTLPLTSRLGVASVLRRVADEAATVVLVRTDGAHRQGRLGRVGADFLEIADDAGVELVALSALAALRRL
jgi:hypothetical protein